LALVNTARDAGSPLKIIETVVDINNKRKLSMADRVVAACDGSIKGKTVAILGVTFKPNTDDMRDSPSLYILPALQKAGASIRAYDPEGMDEACEILENVEWCGDSYEAMQGADVLVIITEWNAFRGLDFERVKSLLSKPVLVDLRNIYNPDDMAAAGIDYHCLGRPPGNAS
jgi:UDPglucose 6-dehydrogenase